MKFKVGDIVVLSPQLLKRHGQWPVNDPCQPGEVFEVLAVTRGGFYLDLWNITKNEETDGRWSDCFIRDPFLAAMYGKKKPRKNILRSDAKPANV